MRNSNRNLDNHLYRGKLDKGGNSQNVLVKNYFSPFYDSKNLQTHGKIPSPNDNFVGGYGYKGTYGSIKKR